MRKIIKNILLCYVCFFLSDNDFLRAAPKDFNSNFINAASSAKPSAVNIISYKVSWRKNEKKLEKVSFGAGTIISKNGYIVTNFHVVNKGDYHQVLLYNGKECDIQEFEKGKNYISDSKTDLALLKLSPEDIQNIDPIHFGNSDSLSEGEWVLAIGNPFGLRQSITCGIVSSKGRNDIGFADIEDFIQTDVPINPGNSGGPLINLKGKLVGINTAIRTISGGYQGISFAIPSNIVNKVCSDLIEYGRVRRGWVGFLAMEKKISEDSENKIIEVISVINNSPADLSGITKGDIILEINNARMSSLGELVNSIGNMPIGSNIRITASRDGKLHDFELTLKEKGAQGNDNRNRDLNKIYSIYGIDIDENSRTGNVVISNLSPMGLAYQNGLKKGDIIISVNGNDVDSLEKFIKTVNKYSYRISNMEIFRDPNIYNVELFND